MSRQLQYKGYVGSIEASTEDKYLFGTVLFIRPLVSYEGQTVAELEAAFREAVDGYLHTCEQLGQKPDHLNN
jgi:predicted HicB family RNase H-like nuclease